MSCNLFSNKVRSGLKDCQRLANYLLAQNGNECAPIVILGDAQAVIHNGQRSRLYGHKDGNIHFQLTSKAPLSRAEAILFVDEIHAVFGIDRASNTGVLVEHRKERLDGSASPVHYHYVCAYTSAEGRAIRMHNSFVLNEYVSRRIERKLGRPLGIGVHGKNVLRRARSDGADELIAAINGVEPSEVPSPKARYKMRQSAAAASDKLDLPALTAELKKLNQADQTAFISSAARIATKHNIYFQQGEKPNVITILHGKPHAGKLIGSLNRLAKFKIQASERDSILARLQEKVQRTEQRHARLFPSENPKRAWESKRSAYEAKFESLERNGYHIRDDNRNDGKPAQHSDEVVGSSLATVTGRQCSDTPAHSGDSEPWRQNGEDGAIPAFNSYSNIPPNLREQHASGRSLISPEPNRRDNGSIGNDNWQALLVRLRKFIRYAQARFVLRIYRMALRSLKSGVTLPELPSVDIRPAGTLTPPPPRTLSELQRGRARG